MFVLKGKKKKKKFICISALNKTCIKKQNILPASFGVPVAKTTGLNQEHLLLFVWLLSRSFIPLLPINVRVSLWFKPLFNKIRISPNTLMAQQGKCSRIPHASHGTVQGSWKRQSHQVHIKWLMNCPPAPGGFISRSILLIRASLLSMRTTGEWIREGFYPITPLFNGVGKRGAARCLAEVEGIFSIWKELCPWPSGCKVVEQPMLCNI